jgi:hypothetical protein
MYLMRSQVGLSASETARIFGRTTATVRDLTRPIARGQRAGDLVAQAQVALATHADSPAMSNGRRARRLGLPTFAAVQG